jgi:hypothetical protein
MTESPIAVTCRPDTFGGLAAALRHAGAEDATAGADDAVPGEEGAGEEDPGDADGPAEALA